MQSFLRWADVLEAELLTKFTANIGAIYSKLKHVSANTPIDINKVVLIICLLSDLFATFLFEILGK